MSLNLRSQVVRSLLLVGVWLCLTALPYGNQSTSRARDFAPEEFLATDQASQDIYGQPEPDVQVPFFDDEMPSPGGRPRAKPAAAKMTRRATAKETADSVDKTKKGASAASAGKKTEGGKGGSTGTGISFRNDVAPILVANCVGCHRQGRPGLTKGKLDMTSFAKLMDGTPEEKVIQPKKPDQSHLVLRVKGEEEPRMPQGGDNNGLSPEAISKIEEWIKSGASLDAGLDPKAAMQTYASSPDQVRRNQIAKMSPTEREQKVSARGPRPLAADQSQAEARDHNWRAFCPL